MVYLYLKSRNLNRAIAVLQVCLQQNPDSNGWKRSRVPRSFSRSVDRTYSSEIGLWSFRFLIFLALDKGILFAFWRERERETHTHTHTHTHRERKRQRQTDRQTDGRTDRQRQRDRERCCNSFKRKQTRCVSVHGGWSQWAESGRTECSTTCGAGSLTITETRTCTNPPPSGRGARPCSGDSSRSVTADCNLRPCPSKYDTEATHAPVSTTQKRPMPQ